MVRKALKWMFYLWLLAGILPLAGSWTSRTVSTWSASRPTPAEARISELSADDLEAAFVLEEEGARAHLTRQHLRGPVVGENTKAAASATAHVFLSVSGEILAD